MKYKTIERFSIEQLDTAINEKLNEGWDLYGNLVIIVDRLECIIYHQGMILMGEEDIL